MIKKYFKQLPYLLWTFIFTVVPLLFIVYFSFKVKDGNTFTYSNYSKFFSGLYIKVIYNSIKLAFIATTLCLLIGFPCAYVLSNIKDNKKRTIYVLLFIIPLWTNFLLRTYSWMGIFREQGVINQLLLYLGLIKVPLKFLYNDYAVVAGMVYNFLPFMVLPIYTAIINIDREYIDVARDLGAKGRELFLKIIIPLSFSGIISGCIMVFMPSVTTFIISDLLGGSQKILVGNLIQREFLQSRNWESGSAISIIMLIIIFITLMIFKKFVSNKNEDAIEGFKIW